MRENQTWFSRKLFDRFFRKYPYIRELLLAMGYPAFQHSFLRAFDSLGVGLRICRSLRSTRKEHWVTLVLEFIPPMDLDRFDQLAETFLEVLSEVVEDAWCPAVEGAWRTAIREIKDELVESGKIGTFWPDPPAGT